MSTKELPTSSAKHQQPLHQITRRTPNPAKDAPPPAPLETAPTPTIKRSSPNTATTPRQLKKTKPTEATMSAAGPFVPTSVTPASSNGVPPTESAPEVGPTLPHSQTSSTRDGPRMVVAVPVRCDPTIAQADLTTSGSESHAQDTADVSVDTPRDMTCVDDKNAQKCISDLHPATPSPWILFARVLATSNPRKWKTTTANGELFDAYVVDRVGDMVKIAVFNEGVDMFHGVLAPGSVCRLTAGKIKHANADYSPDPYELTFDGSSEISALSDHKVPPTDLSLTFTSLAEVLALPVKSKVNIIGVIVECAQLRHLRSARGKPLVKRDIFVVDRSMTKLMCTLWGARAEIDENTSVGKSLILRSGEVTQYNNVTYLNLSPASILLIDPACQQGADITTWYNALPDSTAFVTAA